MLGPAEAKEVIVDEFFAVIGIKAEEPERESRAEGLECFDDGVLVFAKERDAVGPAGEDVGGGEGVEEIPVEGTTAVGDGIDFEIAWTSDVVVERTDGNHGFKKSTGSSGGIEPTPEHEFMGFKPPVELAGADRENLFFPGRGEAKPFSGGGQPKWDGLFKALAAEIARGFPNVPNDLQDGRAIEAGPPAVQTGLGGDGFWGALAIPGYSPWLRACWASVRASC